jgi:hypothetical protein
MKKEPSGSHEDDSPIAAPRPDWSWSATAVA